MSIENQAAFYLRNVCDFEPDIKSNVTLSESVIEGFGAFSHYLRTIYQDWRSYEISTVPSVRTKIGIMTDDLENYHNLTYTLDCLYAIAKVGELCCEGETKYLSVQKTVFKSEYKKSVTFPFVMLEKHGFYFNFFKGEKEINAYKRCDSFRVYFENGRNLIRAMKFIAQRLGEQEKKKEMPAKVAFMLADYHYILVGNINQDPMQKSILTTLGTYQELWQNLVCVLQDECGFVCDSSFNPYVFPCRTITFKKNNKPICKFNINVERFNIRLPLSYEMAKDLIFDRKALPQSVNHSIELFDCVGCGKCENKRNIVMVEGVPLCNLPYSNFVTEDSRCLVLDVTSHEEVSVICDIARKV